MDRRDRAARPAGPPAVERLYPFLYGAALDPAAVLEDAAASTARKLAEIAGLRREVGEADGERIAACAEAMAARFAAGGRLFTFGNGGSATDARQVADTFRCPPYGTPLPALCLAADPAILTALSNDVGFEVVFARQMAALARPGDIALGLSTSGGSTNVVRGFVEARRHGLLTVGVAGYQGGKLAEAGILDFLFVIPSCSVHRIQEAQTTVYHVLWELTRHAVEGRCVTARSDPPRPVPERQGET